MLILGWYMWMVRNSFSFLFLFFFLNPKCNQNFNKNILETLSMSEKALQILLNIFGNVNAAGRLLSGQPSILK